MSFETAKAAWLKENLQELEKLAEFIYGNYAAHMQHRRKKPELYDGKFPMGRTNAQWCLEEMHHHASPLSIILWQAGYDDYEGERL